VAALREVAAPAPGSTLAMTFLLPLELADPDVRRGLQMAEQGARASGTPFVSFFTPAQMLALAADADFGEARHVSALELTERYLAQRTDGLRPPRNAEELLVAQTKLRGQRRERGEQRGVWSAGLRCTCDASDPARHVCKISFCTRQFSSSATNNVFSDGHAIS
jgi:hypothetical protein